MGLAVGIIRSIAIVAPLAASDPAAFMALASALALIAGGSLGPEAPLIDACSSVGTLMSDKLILDERETRALGFSGLSGMLAAMLTSPFGGVLLGLESARASVAAARHRHQAWGVVRCRIEG